MSRQLIRKLHGDEEGAAYSLSVVMLLPVYLACITFFIELLLLFNSYLSLAASLQQAAHLVQTWSLQQDTLANQGESLQQRVHAGLCRNLTPFVTTKPIGDQDRELVPVLQSLKLSGQTQARLSSKSRFISESLQLQLTPESHSLGNTTAKGYRIDVIYQSPLWFPAFRSLLATGSNQHGAYRTIHAHTWTAIERTSVGRRDLGIPFDVLQVTSWE